MLRPLIYPWDWHKREVSCNQISQAQTLVPCPSIIRSYGVMVSNTSCGKELVQRETHIAQRNTSASRFQGPQSPTQDHLPPHLRQPKSCQPPGNAKNSSRTERKLGTKCYLPAQIFWSHQFTCHLTSVYHPLHVRFIPATEFIGCLQRAIELWNELSFTLIWSSTTATFC